MIDLKYKNTEKQICDFSMYRATNSESYKKELKKRSYILFIMLCFAALIYIFVGLKMKDQGKLPMGIIFAAIFFICGVVNLIFFDKFANRHVKKTILKTLKEKGNLIDSTIKFKFDGKFIKLIRNKEKSVIKVESILEVIHLNDCLCIAAKGDPGIVIPFEEFKDKSDMLKFENYLKGK